MSKSSITVVIAEKTYVLQPSAPQAMREIPKQHREQLIGLLEVLKSQHEASQRAVDSALAAATLPGQVPGQAPAGDSPQRDKMGEGDIDDLMARLILEEKRSRKAGLKPATIYKFTAVIVLVILVLMLF